MRINPTRVISVPIGRYNEDNPVTLEIDLTPCIARYGEGTGHVVVYQKGHESYIAATEREGNKLLFPITFTETRVMGESKMELHWVTEEVLVKYPWRAQVLEAMNPDPKDPPEHYEDWLEKLIILKGEAEEAADQAIEYARSAYDSMDEAEGFATDAMLSKNAAIEAKNASIKAKEEAESAKVSAETAESHSKASEVKAEGFYTEAQKSAQIATQKAQEASYAEDNAKESETKAKTYRDEAQTAKTQAQDAEGNADRSAQNAYKYMQDAQTAKDATVAEKTDALQKIGTARTEAIGAVNQKKTEVMQDIEIKKNEVIGEINADEVVQRIDDLESDAIATKDSLTKLCSEVYNIENDFYERVKSVNLFEKYGTVSNLSPNSSGVLKPDKDVTSIVIPVVPGKNVRVDNVVGNNRSLYVLTEIKPDNDVQFYNKYIYEFFNGMSIIVPDNMHYLVVYLSYGNSIDTDGIRAYYGDWSDDNAVKNDLHKIVTKNVGKNILNKSLVTHGFLQDHDNIATNGAYGNYDTSDYIEVYPDTDYTISYVNPDGTAFGYSRIVCMQYDKYKKYISGSYQNVTDINHLTIHTGINASYIRVSFQIADNYGEHIQIEKGSSPTSLDAYTQTYLLNDDVKTGRETEIDDLSFNQSIILKDVIDIVRSPQLFDRTKLQSGYMNNSGSVGISDNYVHSENIDVSDHEGDTIYFSIDGKTALRRSFRFITAFSGKNVNSAKGVNSGECDIYTYTIPSGVDSIVITYYSEVGGGSEMKRFQAEFDGITPYSEYGYAARLKDSEFEKIAKGEALKHDILNGKKWAVCGDSFTAAGYSPMRTLDEGKYKGKNYTYPWLIGNRTEIDIYDFSQGGRTLAYPEVSGGFNNSLTCPTAQCFYQNIPEDTDYITIYLGINDGHHRSSSSGGDGEDNTGVIPLGTINDSTVHTYYGAWNVVIPWLMEHRPFAHIGIIVSNGCDSPEYRTAQLEIAKKYGIPYIDLNGDERTPMMIRSQNEEISQAARTIVTKKQAVDYDGSRTGSVNTHPNDEAHEYESWFIENFLRSL